MSRFRFFDDHRAEYPVKRPCELVEVSRAGFYAWRSRPTCPHAVGDAELVVEIRAIHERSRGTFGAPRSEGQFQRWTSRAELRVALFDCIEAFYNRTRHQAGLEHQTPSETYAASHVA